MLGFVENPLGGIREPLRGREELTHDLVGAGRGPHAVEEPREETAASKRSLDVLERPDGEVADAVPVVGVETAKHVHPEALARRRAQPVLGTGHLE